MPIGQYSPISQSEILAVHSRQTNDDMRQLIGHTNQRSNSDQISIAIARADSHQILFNKINNYNSLILLPIWLIPAYAKGNVLLDSHSHFRKMSICFLQRKTSQYAHPRFVRFISLFHTPTLLLKKSHTTDTYM